MAKMYSISSMKPKLSRGKSHLPYSTNPIARKQEIGIGRASLLLVQLLTGSWHHMRCNTNNVVTRRTLNHDSPHRSSSHPQTLFFSYRIGRTHAIRRVG